MNGVGSSQEREPMAALMRSYPQRQWSYAVKIKNNKIMLYNKHNLAVAKIASKSGNREELASVFFSKDKTAATDSFRLLEVSVNKSVKAEEFPQVEGVSAMRGCNPFLVSAKQVAELKPKGAKHLPITEFVAVKHLDDKRVEFLTTDLESLQVKQARRVDGKFPDYEQVFPQGEPQAEVVLNGEMLAELLKVMAGLHEQVRVKFYGKNKPLVFECGTSEQKARGLMMPIRE